MTEFLKPPTEGAPLFVLTSKEISLGHVLRSFVISDTNIRRVLPLRKPRVNGKIARDWVELPLVHMEIAVEARKHALTIGGRVNGQELARVDAAARLVNQVRAHFVVQAALDRADAVIDQQARGQDVIPDKRGTLPVGRVASQGDPVDS